MPADPVIEWLLQGDEAIRWQVMRDLLDAPEPEWSAEKGRVPQGGWSTQFLALQDPKGTWGGGIYSPKWTSTCYTLLTLIDMGVDRATPEAVKGARLIIDQVARYFKDGADKALQQTDLCVYGFYLGLGAVFVPDDPVLPKVAHLLHKAQMADGGWNCRMPRVNGVKHSSFHTTFNVLEGFRLAVEVGAADAETFEAAEARALEFMLEHRMFKSDKTGEIVNSHFTEFSYPPRWHYDVLRGMDYIRSTSFRTDPRLADALALIERRRNSDGTWPAQNKHAGKTLFTLESPPRRSRWNTLRALRVLKTCG